MLNIGKKKKAANTLIRKHINKNTKANLLVIIIKKKKQYSCQPSPKITKKGNKSEPPITGA